MLACVATAAPRIYDVDGLTMFGAEIDHPGLGYFLINRDNEGGAHHYVELWDQVFGRFDGVKHLEIAADRRCLLITLNFAVNCLGNEFAIEYGTPMDAESVRWVEELAAEIEARR